MLASTSLRPAPLCVAAALLAISLSAASLAHGRFPIAVPVDRVVANLEAFVKEHPNDAKALYRLGRVHAMAFETKSRQVGMWQNGNDTDAHDEPTSNNWNRLALGMGDGKAAGATAPDDAMLRLHLAEAVKRLSESLVLDPNSAATHLALASALEAGVELAAEIPAHPLAMQPLTAKEGSDWAATSAKTLREEGLRQALGLRRVQPGPDWGTSMETRRITATIVWEAQHSEKPPEFLKQLLIEDWREQIKEHYFTAMCLALPAEGRTEVRPIWGSMEDFIAYESGKGFLSALKLAPPLPHDAIRVKVVSATLDGFEALPTPTAITPIVFPISATTAPGLSPLLAPSARVTFDLDGTGRPQQWSWVGPETGILVWDPDHTGRITSGRELFGSVTWWMMFENGYQALDSLDDDRDGVLRGEELKGIAVWVDRNGNGVSDPGEVTPIAELGISAIRTHSTSTVEGCPAHLTGIEYTSGCTAPTYDWVTTSIPREPREPRTPTTGSAAPADSSPAP